MSTSASPASNPRVGFVSLGCPKALVDSERILTQLKVEGYDIVQTYDDADVVVVNTCGFIDSAVAESLDAIGEAMAGNGKVIVTGCLGKREEVIRQAHPGVLSISGPQDYASVMGAVHTALPPKHDPFIDLVPRRAAEDDIGVKLTPHHYAYLKISEGCNHRCSFCIIRSEEHTSELQSLMRSSYAVFCLKKKNDKLLHTRSLTEPKKHNTESTT